MANVLPAEKQTAILSALCEGSSIRSTERMTGCHRDSIMRLGLRVGAGCDKLLDVTMRELQCKQIQMDEIWGFIGKKQRTVTSADPEEFGTVWTFVALDPETKIVPTFAVGKRDHHHTSQFLHDLSSRIINRVQISTDGMNQYLETIDDAFGDQADYGQIVKIYGGGREDEEPVQHRRYSPPPVIGINRRVVSGSPVISKICTSHVERQNFTMRMHIRRLTRLTNAFSKKLENFRAAVALHFAYYNFVRIHSTIRCTPAMAAGVTNRIWRMEDLAELGRAA